MHLDKHILSVGDVAEYIGPCHVKTLVLDLLKKTKVRDNGNLQPTTSHEYDVFGNKTKQTIRLPNGSESMMEKLASNDDSDGGRNFKIKYRLYAGTTYVIGAKMFCFAICLLSLPSEYELQGEVDIKT